MRIQKDDCVDLAAEISFYFSLSLLPFCLVLAAIVGWLPSTILWKAFAAWVVTYLPRDSQHLIFSTILGLVDYSRGFLSFGLLTALWSASAGFVSLMESLSLIYAGKESRPFWRTHAIALGVTMLSMVFALGVFGLAAFGHLWMRAVRGGHERLAPGANRVDHRALAGHRAGALRGGGPGEFRSAGYAAAMALADAGNSVCDLGDDRVVRGLESLFQAFPFVSEDLWDVGRLHHFDALDLCRQLDFADWSGNGSSAGDAGE